MLNLKKQNKFSIHWSKIYFLFSNLVVKKFLIFVVVLKNLDTTCIKTGHCSNLAT